MIAMKKRFKKRFQHNLEKKKKKNKMNESGFSYLYHYMKGVLVEEGKRKSSVSFSLTYMRCKDVMGNLTISSRTS